MHRMVGYRFIEKGRADGLKTSAPATVGRCLDEVQEKYPHARPDIYNWCPISLCPVEMYRQREWELEFCPVFSGDTLVAIFTRNFTDDDQEGR